MPKKTKSIRKLAHDFVFNRIHRSQLIYNTCWEDPAIDRKLMRLNPESRVVMITSAGCNALDYLLDDPGEIHCIDVNPRQNALLHLKMAAIKRLSFEDFFLLFGCGCHAKIERIFSAVKYDMPDFARHYWEGKLYYFTPTRLKRSFYYHGAAGSVAMTIRLLLGCRRSLRSQVYDLLDSSSLEEQKAIYAGFAPEFWTGFVRLLVKSPLTMALLGVPRSQIQLIETAYPGGLGAYVQDKIAHVFTEVPMADNYFWRVYLRGEYSSRCCPEYLKERNFNLLKHRLDRISVHTTTVSGFLEESSGKYSDFVLLDHQDWLAAHDRPGLDQEWRRILDRSREHARILMRSASDRFDFIPQPVASRLKPDAETAPKLHNQDRVGTYAGLLFAEVV